MTSAISQSLPLHNPISEPVLGGSSVSHVVNKAPKSSLFNIFKGCCTSSSAVSVVGDPKLHELSTGSPEALPLAEGYTLSSEGEAAPDLLLHSRGGTPLVNTDSSGSSPSLKKTPNNSPHSPLSSNHHQRLHDAESSPAGESTFPVTPPKISLWTQITSFCKENSKVMAIACMVIGAALAVFGIIWLTIGLASTTCMLASTPSWTPIIGGPIFGLGGLGLTGSMVPLLKA